jgi:hypothetical protein
MQLLIMRIIFGIIILKICINGSLLVRDVFKELHFLLAIMTLTSLLTLCYFMGALLVR